MKLCGCVMFPEGYENCLGTGDEYILYTVRFVYMHDQGGYFAVRVVGRFSSDFCSCFILVKNRYYNCLLCFSWWVYFTQNICNSSQLFFASVVYVNYWCVTFGELILKLFGCKEIGKTDLKENESNYITKPFQASARKGQIMDIK
jgi:hypothetical protein